MRQEVLGIDIGGVISEHRNDTRSAEADPEAYLRSPAVRDSCETIARLVAERFGDRVYFVSKCRWKMQLKTRLWLAEQKVYEATGIARDHVWFCLERHEKAEICKVLGVTHFVDDRLEILGSLVTVPHKVLFRPKPHEVERYKDFLPLVTRVESWNEVPAALPRIR